MCASYNPPSETITQFNSSLFNQIEDTLSQTEADTLYLSKKKNDTSTAPLTTFTGAVNSYGDLTVGQRGISGGIFNIYRRQRIWDINNASQTYGDLYSTGADMNYTVLNQGGAIETYHRFYTCPSTSSTASLNLEIGNTTTKIFNALESGTSGVPTSGLYLKAGATMYDISSPYTTFLQLYPSSSGMNYIMNNASTNIATSHNFKTYNTSNIQTTPLQISSATTTITNTLTATTSNFSGVITMLGGVPITLKDVTNTNYVDTKCVSTQYQVNNPSASGSAIFNFNSVPAVEINNTNTKVYNRIDVGTNGAGQTSYFRTAVQMMDISSPYTNYNQVLTNGAMALYNMTGNMTQHRFATYNAVPAQVVSLDIYSNQMVSRVPITIMDGQVSGPETQITQSGNDLIINNAQSAATTYLKFNNVTSVETSAVQFTTYLPIRLMRPTYSFPFALAQHQGYYLKTTGTAQSIVSATPKTILTTPSIAIGVWRIDFSVINTVTTGGTITQSQNFVSNTNNGAIATAVDFTGSVLRTHVSEVYATNDVQEIASSFTYNQSTAGVLYLNIVRSFATGVYSFVGELSITRLA